VKDKVSIIVRTKNEERWINSCLRSIFEQTYKNFEVIIVDNYSKDLTIKLAKRFKVKIVKIKNFKPGKAINLGIRNSVGKIIVCLSGHCVPKDKNWLLNLISNLKLKNVAAVYGRQEPFSFSSDLDKRDLINTFGLDKKIQIKDSFFHNANSAFKKNIWKKMPFDENASNIEDRLWANDIIKKKLKIVYEPKASVYHWHGINHDLDTDRAKSIVRILETINKNENKFSRKLSELKIAAIIPIKGESKKYKKEKLLQKTIKETLKSKYISEIYVSTDNTKTMLEAKKLGARSPFLRPNRLSYDYVDINEVLYFTINKLEDKKKNFDIIVCLEESYPNRTSVLIDKMIKHFYKSKLDTLIAGYQENRGILKQNKDMDYDYVNDLFMPRSIKEKNFFISLFGLCAITTPNVIRAVSTLKDSKVGIYKITNFIETQEIR